MSTPSSRRADAALGASFGGGRKKLNIEKFLIFNQQFVTLIKAGLPILKGLDLLADRLADPKLGPYIKAVRDDVRSGSLLSDAFEKQGIFPPVYVTSVLAGEKSGALAEVLDRFITYQKTALAIRKKVIVSLIYPCFLVVLVIGLIIFLVTFVVPNFAELYGSMSAQLPADDADSDRRGHDGAQLYSAGCVAVVIAAVIGFRIWSRGEAARLRIDSREAADPDLRRHLGEVSGGAVLAHSEHSAAGRHSAGAGARHGIRVARNAAVEAGSRKSCQNG